MTGGTSSVAMIAPKTIFLPQNSSRARAYAAAEAVTRMMTVCSVAAPRLFRNHRKIGCWPLANVVYASIDHGFGKAENGLRMASPSVLNDVSTIQTSGRT